MSNLFTKGHPIKTGLLLLCVIVFPASAAYKCVDAGGKTSFQDAPCERSQVQSALRNLATPDAPITVAVEQPTYRATSDRLEIERLLRENTRTIASNQDRCDYDQRAIFGRQTSSTNTLAGATRDGAIASEAQAAAARCDTRTRQLLVDRDDLRKTCEARKCSMTGG